MTAEFNVGPLGYDVTQTFQDSVDDTDPSDVYGFSLSEAQPLNLSLTGITENTDVDVRLYRDINGNGQIDYDVDQAVASSIRGSNQDDFINLDSLDAGQYLADVYQYAGDSPYTLSLSTTNPSNLLPTEVNVGSLTDTQTFFGSVNSTNTADTYRFSLDSASALNLSLTGLSQDADVRLIQDSNNNGVIDDSDVIESSVRASNFDESINLSSLGQGDYFAQVYQYSGDTDYTLSLSATNPSNLLPTEVNVGSLTDTQTFFGSVNSTNTADTYRFSLDGASALNLSLTGLSQDADVRLIQDSNNNGVIDDIDVIESSVRASNFDESINLSSLGQGDYFAQVYQYSGDTDYTLSLSTTNPSNLLPTEVNVGSLTGTQTFFGSVNSTDTADTYRFSLDSASALNLSLTGLSQDADVRLIQDSNNNGVIDDSDVIESSVLPSNLDESINLSSLAQGDYFAQVYQFSGDTDYTLSLSTTNPSNLLPTEVNVGSLTGTQTFFGSVNGTDTADTYRFSLDSASALNLSLTGLSQDADVRLIQDSNNNGVIDDSDVIESSVLPSNFDESINLSSLGQGDYFAQVYQFSGDTDYTLSLSATNSNDLLVNEVDIGSVTGPQVFRDSVGSTDTSDLYRFSVDFDSPLNITAKGLSSTASVRFIQDVNSNGLVESGEFFSPTAREGVIAANLSSLSTNNLSPGTFYVQVSDTDNSNYSLGISTSGPSDLLVPENDLGTLDNGARNFSDSVSSFDTSDLYNFSLSESRSFTASISGLSSDADLRLIQDLDSNDIIDSTDLIIDSTFGGTTTDTVNSLLDAGNYFVQVYQFSGDTSYNLGLTVS
ncbi:pre-peptidase C-terminal domain-containing protein [Leptolyngbya sp. FACHB-261]|uniref:pre-peptidase C-terminal domain-containing protein n=1 Tax=Leptolyngbya sp. FACHB-261 TaxID=2692806 RepID=UPI0016856149|nr:pre-peptidase C-terminal domain-containing protein [Leptolyngbya sp. FACHB-261]MBD2102046.1 pre-peptidase C-terminal domain-containing protein [Leptolyngbya sp. FACHB-261]